MGAVKTHNKDRHKIFAQAAKNWNRKNQALRNQYNRKIGFNRNNPNRSYTESEIAGYFGISSKYWENHKTELDKLYESWIDGIINGTSENIDKPIGLFSEIFLQRDQGMELRGNQVMEVIS